MQPIQKQKKKDEEKGFDLLQAKFLDQGLVAAGDTRSLGLRAVGQTHSHVRKHHTEKLEGHERKFKSDVKRASVRSVRLQKGSMASITPVKVRMTQKPNQLKDKGGSDSGEKGSDSGKKE